MKTPGAKATIQLILSAAISVLGLLFSSASATTLFDSTVTGANCGTSCYGLTYRLTITDANDSDATTYTADLQVTGTASGLGSATHIASVDFKPGSTATSATLIAAPGNLASWMNSIGKQAGTDCGAGNGGFVCSKDLDTNSAAPLGGLLNDSWQWNFTQTGTLGPGHLGVRFNNADDTLNGLIMSSVGFDSPNLITSFNGNQVPEPSALALVLTGLALLLVKRGARQLIALAPASSLRKHANVVR